jgi:serine/threonine-protein kinase
MKRIAKMYLVPVCGALLFPACSQDYGSETGADTDDGGNASDGSGDSGDSSGDGGGSGNDSDGGDDSDGDNPGGGGDCNAEQQWTMDFLDTHCAACHGAGSPGQGGFDYVDNYAQLLSSGKIVPGDPDASPIFARVDAGTMPPQGVQPQPSADQIARLGDFIATCADEPPEAGCGDNPPITAYDVLRRIQDDVTLVDVDDRPFTRYFTLTHLYNAGLCEEDLDAYRYATAKLINALSTEAIIEAPVAIDAEETIYRIDIREYGWDQPLNGFADKWEALVAANPYSVERLEDEAETIKILTETNVPVQPADAFIDIASQPPLYHDLVGIPQNFNDLQLTLGLNVDQDVADEEVARAGVLDSGVSRQNRIIERHEIPLAANRVLWVSYDFIDDSQEEQNIFASPLDFQEAGGEMIFSLPNGLHAYMLMDNQGNRLDVAPDAIVTDPSQEDQNVRNGISCFGCHPSMLMAEDAVRDYVLTGVEFDAQTKDTVENIYPESSEFQELIDFDTQNFQNSVAAAGVDTSLTLEPIADTFGRFQLNVNLEIAAAELGVSAETLLTQLGGLDPALSPLASGSIKRDTWTSLFANTVCLLNIGEANDAACGVDDGQ